MSDLAKRMNSVWNKTSPRNAHLGISGEKEFLYNRYRALVTDKIDVNEKIIIDFGIGGGLLGKYLFENFKIKKYIGYDLAERSINTAKNNLVNYKEKELILINRHVWNFKEKNPNIIVCIACIFHFPTLTYLNNFLNECNLSESEYLILEIRNFGKGNIFQSDPYSTVKQSLMACTTTDEYVTNKLSNYKLIEKTDWKLAPTNCQILWYKRNG
jgi:2-polyprenyl-3-methyl-5-hydroxy-6-metoxy-1,4-benzoquinol methylase